MLKDDLIRVIQEYAEKQHYNPADDLQFVIMEESFKEFAQAIIDRLEIDEDILTERLSVLKLNTYGYHWQKREYKKLAHTIAKMKPIKLK